jgi:hypothetical protein
MRSFLSPVTTLALLVSFTGALACAKSQPPAETPPRIKDSVPEKIAAQRAAQKDLKLEEDDERWGVEQARERKERAKAKSDDAAAPPPSGPMDLGGTRSTVAPK